MTDQITRFLNGDTSKIKVDCQKKMRTFSENLEFEKAQEMKLILEAIDEINKKQNIKLKDLINRDVISYSSRDGYFSLCIMTYRKGILLGNNLFVLECFDNQHEDLIDCIYQYYINHELPNEIIVADNLLSDELSYLLERKVISPTRGVKKDLLLIALENAKKGLDEHFLTARLEDDS